MMISARGFRFMRVGALAALAASVFACSTADPTTMSDPRASRSSRLDDADRWQPASSTATGTYEGLNGEGCSGGLKPGTQQLGEQMKTRFGTDFGGYSCRANTANPKELSIHAVGRALDITTSGDQGTEIANFIVTNATTLGVDLVIWNHTLWKVTPSGPSSRAYTGPNPHTDHVHAEVTSATAANGPGTVDGAGTPTDPAVDDDGGVATQPTDPNGDPLPTDPNNNPSNDNNNSPIDPNDPNAGVGDPMEDDGGGSCDGEELDCQTDADCDPSGQIMCDQGYCIF